MELMFYLPHMTVSLNLKLIGWKFINNQSIEVPSFFFHNILSKYMEEDNKDALKKWIKATLTDNLGKLLGNGFTNIASNSLFFLLSCGKQLLLLPGNALKAIVSWLLHCFIIYLWKILISMFLLVNQNLDKYVNMLLKMTKWSKPRGKLEDLKASWF